MALGPQPKRALTSSIRPMWPHLNQEPSWSSIGHSSSANCGIAACQPASLSIAHWTTASLWLRCRKSDCATSTSVAADARCSFATSSANSSCRTVWSAAVRFCLASVRRPLITVAKAFKAIKMPRKHSTGKSGMKPLQSLLWGGVAVSIAELPLGKQAAPAATTNAFSLSQNGYGERQLT